MSQLCIHIIFILKTLPVGLNLCSIINKNLNNSCNEKTCTVINVRHAYWWIMGAMSCP